ncbi:GCN5-related N-acetyltransferase [Mycolicibacterium rhodesiae JS60]|nr:GCN5-related N-acetyltransferase [Mycolicibacterium rhodesiae JS60]
MWQLRTGSADDLDIVEPLWVAVHHRHAETMPELRPYVSDDDRVVVEDTWVADTCATGSRIGEIESLWVLPEFRGSGLGSELLTRLEEHLRASSVDDLVLGVLPGNRDALWLYERLGYRPTWLYLSKFAGRD